jgi:hypothetical protein
MPLNVIVEREFTDADQEWFASVTGDRNPMHMDALAARRTMAGFPVVHGIHTLLWTLDNLFRHLPDLGVPISIRASFEKMIYIGDRVRAVLLHHDHKRLRMEVLVEDVTAIGLDVEFGDPRPADATIVDGPVYQPTEPSDLTFDQMVACHGLVPLPDALASMSQMFPAVAGVLGVERVAGLACSSFLVGMVCPGLHSIYRNLNLAVTPLGEDDHDRLHFWVKYSDLDYRLLRLAVSGAGWTGVIDTNARPEPATQADLASIATRVTPGEFRGASALVIGGSRGLGELVAKILSVGGAHVTLTYAVGEADARRLQAQINDFGGRCDIMRYDVRKDAGEQLSRLAATPTELYYMATPMIFQRASGGFSAQRLQAFLTFYVMGFSDVCRALRSHAGSDLAIFYPSSISIDERPANMTEYTMAKAAGEVLCADMQSFEKWARILVKRLPRLPTDQTATLFDDDDPDDPVEVMLTIVRELHARRAG